MKLIKKMLEIINFFIPKKQQVCFFGPWNNKTGNNYLFLKFLKKYNPKNIKYISVSSNDIMSFKLKNIKKLLNIFSSKIIITTHGPLSIKSKNQILISFFHGFLTKDGGLNVKNGGYTITDYNKINYQLTTSKLASCMYSYNWCLHPSKYIYLGEPILEYLEELKNNSKIKNRINKIKGKYNKIVLYAPTYRGGDFNSYDINEVIKHFFKIIENNTNNYFIISLHPVDKDNLKKEYIEKINQHSNIEIYNDDTNTILPFIDTLITDASSIVYYGIYLKKEIIIFFPDYKKYIEGIDLFWSKFDIFDNEIIFLDNFNIKNFSYLLNNYNISLDKIRKMLFYKDYYYDNKKIYNFICSLLK